MSSIWATAGGSSRTSSGLTERRPGSPRRAHAIAIACVVLSGVAATCPSAAREITATDAVKIARAHATFEIESADPQKTTDSGRPVWQVTLRGKPASPDFPELRPIVIVLIDRRSGEVVGIAKS